MIHDTVTPSGYVIQFEDGEPDPETGKSKRRAYLCGMPPEIEPAKLVSVTTALGVLDKPGLKYAAEKLAVEGAIKLAREGELPVTVDGALSRMKSRGLRFWQVWETKAQRGDVGHDDLVKLCIGQEIPDLDSYPDDQQGVIRAVSSWFADERPVIPETEVMVASLEHGFAGRPDMFGVLPQQHRMFKCLLDLKTTELLPRRKDGTVKPPYPEMLLQLGAYEIGRRESGYEPSDYQAVLRVDTTGAYDLFCTVVDPDPFLAVLGAYKALRGVPTKPTPVPAQPVGPVQPELAA